MGKWNAEQNIITAARQKGVRDAVANQPAQPPINVRLGSLAALAYQNGYLEGRRIRHAQESMKEIAQ